VQHHPPRLWGSRGFLVASPRLASIQGPGHQALDIAKGGLAVSRLVGVRGSTLATLFLRQGPSEARVSWLPHPTLSRLSGVVGQLHARDSPSPYDFLPARTSSTQSRSLPLLPHLARSQHILAFTEPPPRLRPSFCLPFSCWLRPFFCIFFIFCPSHSPWELTRTK